MRREALLSHPPRHLVLHFAHKLGVELDILLALRLDLGFPGREGAGDVLEGGVALDGEFTWDARCC